MPYRTEDDLIEHLFNKSIIDYDTGCILWQGCVAGKGYGVTCWRGKQAYVHRIAYQFEYPTEKLNVIRHICDIPNCWRVDHLVNGTTADNVADKVHKKRHVFGADNYNAAFTPSTIHYIKARKTWKHVP